MSELIRAIQKPMQWGGFGFGPKPAPAPPPPDRSFKPPAVPYTPKPGEERGPLGVSVDEWSAMSEQEKDAHAWKIRKQMFRDSIKTGGGK